MQHAIDHARRHETLPEQVAYDYSNQDPWPGDPAEHAGALGPFPDRRGGQNGIVVRELRDPRLTGYNDVRINRLVLSLLRVWAKPLPRVLAHEVIDSIGATRTWEWHGYYNSDVEDYNSDVEVGVGR